MNSKAARARSKNAAPSDKERGTTEDDTILLPARPNCKPDGTLALAFTAMSEAVPSSRTPADDVADVFPDHPRGGCRVNILPPHDQEAEAACLGCIFGAVNGESERMLDELNEADFYELRHLTVFRTLLQLQQDAKPLTIPEVYHRLKSDYQVEDAGGLDYLQRLPDKSQSPAAFVTYKRTVKDFAERRNILAEAEQMRVRALDISRPIDSEPVSTLLETLQHRRFDPAKQPPEVEARFTLQKQTVCTPGNLTTITAAVKTGKTAVIGSMIAAAFPHIQDADLLGFNSSNPDCKAIVTIDSEQAPEDHWNLCATATRRAGLEKSPAWFYSYCLSGLDCGQAWRLTLESIRLAAESHGGIHSILLDGAADFVADVNDPEQSNRFVATLHGLAIEHHCPIVTVIHFNPGSEKSRGHLGSQLERKAESNLALEKDSDEITVIYSTKQRRAPIPKHIGPRFAYSVEQGMHVSVESKAASKEQLERETLSQLAAEVFQGRSAMRYSEIQSTLKTTLGVSDNTADRKLTKFHQLRIVKKSAAGLYVLNT